MRLMWRPPNFKNRGYYSSFNGYKLSICFTIALIIILPITTVNGQQNYDKKYDPMSTDQNQFTQRPAVSINGIGDTKLDQFDTTNPNNDPLYNNINGNKDLDPNRDYPGGGGVGGGIGGVSSTSDRTFNFGDINGNRGYLGETYGNDQYGGGIDGTNTYGGGVGGIGNDPFGTGGFGGGGVGGGGGFNDQFGSSGTSNRDFNSIFGVGGGGNRNNFENTNTINHGRGSFRKSFLETTVSNPFNEATYFIVSSRMVRPGQVYRISVQILLAPQPITVRASIARDGVEMSHDSKDVKEGVPETLLMRVPTISVPGNYKLRVEGLYNDAHGGIAFINETQLTFSQRSMTIFVQTDKPTYMQGETVKFRTIPITTSLRGFDNAIDVYMIDPNKHILRRWLSRQSNLGTVSLSYKLSDQPVFGEWTIRIIAQGQIEEHKFVVEEYYQTRFEVNVTMPAFFFSSDPYIYGKVMANFTSGAPVKGNLTIRATIRPIGWYNSAVVNQKYRVGNTGPRYLPDYHIHPNYLNNPNIGPSLQYGQNFDSNYNNINYDYDQQQRYGGGGGGIGGGGLGLGGGGGIGGGLGGGGGGYYDQYQTDTYYNFNEEWPFWVKKPVNREIYDPWTKTYRYELPYLRFFNGTFEFRYPMPQLEQMVPNLAGMEIMITATVGEKFLDEVIRGYAMTRVYNSSIKVSFLGGSPQVFKPTMPFTCYLAAEYHDGSPINFQDNFFQQQVIMDVSGYVESNAGGRREYPARRLMMTERNGIWELKIDLRNDLRLGEDRTSNEFLAEVTKMVLQANFIDQRGERANTDLLLMSHNSPRNRHIKVSTSTRNAKVGEYIIFHIQTNFFVETFNYMLLSKGISLLTGQEAMREGIRTMAVTLSAEMAPVATIVVWHVGHHGLIVADSLTFPVNGISRNNFTVFINNRKARTGERVEIAVYGEPGAYVGLSGIDNAFYTMQAGNELTYAKVITKMSTFDEQTNGTHKHTWFSHEGNPDELVYFPSSSYGIDANRTFEYSGLVVFTDSVVPRRPVICNHTLGFGECLTGRCYRLEKQCDGYRDCEDGTDEINCLYRNFTSVIEYRKYRFNRIKRHYDNVWLWKDINIGPHGRFIFTVDVPEIPAFWMVSAFSVSPTMGFGMIQQAIKYVGVQPFFINVEMPTTCRQGEQIGVRVTVFNYQTTAIEAIIVLEDSKDFKFVHVEEDGIVRSYNPRTSFGEHQFFIYIEAQGTSIVYLPIVPQRLGDVDITIRGSTLLGSDTIKRKLHVESDGVPQYRHQSILLDLSNRAYVFQYMHVNVTETPIIPYEIDRYYIFGSNRAYITVVGDVVGPIFPTMPVNATSLLHLPMDSAEQNMFSFAANFYNVMYMRLINQRNRTVEKHAFHYMNIGYQRQLSYMKADGSFSLFRSDWNTSASSVWLTAYCARSFQDASFYEWENFIYIDPLVIQKAIRWVIRHQSDEGAFYEVTWSPDRKMNSTLHMTNDRKYRNISLTAHVLISLVTVKDLSGSLGAKVANAQQRAILWLERNLAILDSDGEPYEIALVAYALILSGAPTAERAFQLLKRHERSIGEFIYWGNVEVPLPPTKLENQKLFSLPRLPYEYDALNIETTSYALLCYVLRNDPAVERIVQWINAQRLTDGGWASTQDTGMAMKALIDYTVKSRIREVSGLNITIEATSLPGKSRYLTIDKNNFGRLQGLEIPNAWGTVKVQSRGAGYGILQMHVQYNVDIKRYQTQPPVRSFDLWTNALFHGRNQSHITYTACQSWTNFNESIRSGMAVLDVTIPTGYWIQQQKLDAYILSRRVRNLQRARYQEKKVLFYFDFLDQEKICVNFTIERWYPVANMSRYLPIRVYDYYAPERFNETIFDSLPTYLLNICEVCGSSQCPYCSIYNAAIRSVSSLSITLLIASIVVICLRNLRFTSSNDFLLQNNNRLLYSND